MPPTVLPQVAKGIFEYRNLDYDTSTVVDPIVINTWYTALLPTEDVKAWYIIVEQTNTGASDEDLEIEFIIDGAVEVFALAGRISGSVYYLLLNHEGNWYTSGSVSQILSRDVDQSAPLETRSLGIRVRQTSAVDVTSAIIEVNMVYATLEVTY